MCRECIKNAVVQLYYHRPVFKIVRAFQFYSNQIKLVTPTPQRPRQSQHHAYKEFNKFVAPLIDVCSLGQIRMCAKKIIKKNFETTHKNSTNSFLGNLNIS